MYAQAEQASVFKSTNGGGSWSAINTGLPSAGFVVLAIDRVTPTTLYKSTDGASSWQAANTASTGNTYVTAQVTAEPGRSSASRRSPTSRQANLDAAVGIAEPKGRSCTTWVDNGGGTQPR
jgi:hypothetical protein